MRKSKRVISQFTSGFVLSVPCKSRAQRKPADLVGAKVCEYMFSNKQHDIKEVERVAMDAYEELIAMHTNTRLDVKFRWRVLAKQQVPPFTERYVFGIYTGINILLLSVAEPVVFKGRVRSAKQQDYNR